MRKRLKQNVSTIKCTCTESSLVARIPLQPSVEYLECILHTTTLGTHRLHAFMHQIGLDTHATLGNCLMSLLIETGNIHRTCNIMETMALLPDESCWNSLITAMIKCGEFQRALNLYHKSQAAKPHCNGYAFVALLKACAELKDAATGSQLHVDISATHLLDHDIYIGNALIDMYTKCGLLAKAQDVFDKLLIKDVVSWTSLIAGYSKHELGKKALECYDRMQLAGISPNAVTYVCTLKACGIMGSLETGYEIHFEISKKGLFENLFVGSALVDMYAKCGALTRAQEVFDKLSARDLISWNALIAGYANHEQGEEAIDRYEQMQVDGFSPDGATFVSTLKACGSICAIDKGQDLYTTIAQRGLLDKEIEVGNAVIDMYAKCGWLSKAREVFCKLPFRNEVSWNALIAGYTKHQEYEEAIHCVNQMQLEGFSPNDVTLVCLLNSCSNMKDMSKCQEIHAEMERKDSLKENCTIGCALVDMYMKCGFLGKAREVFNELSNRNVILWTTLIAGYVQHEFANEALDCLQKMFLEGISPNGVTYACSLKACGMLGATSKGGELHAETARNGLLIRDITIQTTLVEMYAKVGLLAKAQEVFEKLPTRDVFSWNALIAGYANLGDSTNVLQTFEKLRLDGLQPDLATFCNVLSVCNVSGLLGMGNMCLDSMHKDYGISPTIEHHTCMIDLYSRVGHLDRAVALVKRLPFDPDSVIWNVLLDACQRWGSLELAKSTFKHTV